MGDRVMMITGENRTKTRMLNGVIPGYASVKKIARNTIKLTYPNGTEIIRYWDTDVVTKNPDKSIILNSGGFMTKTTKTRIEENTKIRIVQRNNIWYIVRRNIHQYPENKDLDTLPLFYDGIIISDTGDILSGKKILPDKTIKQFKKDVDKLCKMVTKDHIPLPDAGDCIICRVDIASKKASYDHLLSHVKEGYMHGSLIWLCLELSGFKPGVHIQLKMVDNIRRCIKRVIYDACIPVLLNTPEIYADYEVSS